MAPGLFRSPEEEQQAENEMSMTASEMNMGDLADDEMDSVDYSEASDGVIEEDEILEFEVPRASILKVAARSLLRPEPAPSARGTAGIAQAAQVLDSSTQVALARAAGLWVLYVTAAAVAICKEAKRQTISATDVKNAMKSLKIESFIEPCLQHLDADKASRPKHAPTLKKYRGVYQGSINAWYSQISIAGQPIHLGSFAAPEDAAKAYDRAIWSKLGTAAAELLNFPEDFPDSAQYLNQGGGEAADEEEQQQKKQKIDADKNDDDDTAPDNNSLQQP